MLKKKLATYVEDSLLESSAKSRNREKRELDFLAYQIKTGSAL